MIFTFALLYYKFAQFVKLGRFGFVYMDHMKINEVSFRCGQNEAERTLSVIFRMMSNVRWDRMFKKSHVVGVVLSVVLYGILVWILALKMIKYKGILLLLQRRCAVSDFCMQDTVGRGGIDHSGLGAFRFSDGKKRLNRSKNGHRKET